MTAHSPVAGFLHGLNEALQGNHRMRPYPDNPIDRDCRPCWLKEYVGGTLLTGGMFPSPESAKAATGIVHWIETKDGWRSPDGRTLIVMEGPL